VLVLSRKKDEAVQISIGGGLVIHVFVVEIRGDKVRIGFEAPANVAVNRAEVVAELALAAERAS
jgi:carbon storage regulator